MKIKIQNLSSLAFFLIVLAGCIDQKNSQALEAEGGKWANFYKAGDLDGLMTLYTENAVVALHGQPALFGKDAIRNYFKSRIGKADVTFELDYEVRESDTTLGYIISKYWLVAKNRDSGQVYRDAGRSLLVYRKEKNQWKIAADIDQSTPDVRWPSPSGLNSSLLQDSLPR